MEQKCLVMFVDDHEDSAFMFQALLQQFDYDVRTAGSAAEAMQLAQAHSFDLYVLDKRLPDLSGIELCKQLHAHTPNTPIIVYTGDAYQLVRQQAYAAGA